MPHIMLVHDVVPEVFPEYQKIWRQKFVWSKTRQAIQTANALITVSQFSAQEIGKHLSVAQDKIFIAHLGVPVSFAQAQLEPVEKLPETYIYHGGGLEVRKNTQAVLEAYVSLKEKKEGKVLPKLVISGLVHSTQNPLAFDVQSFIQKEGLTEDVLLTGQVSFGQLKTLYTGALAFVYPSLYEGFGLPVLEAMSVGCPVIATQATSLPEVCTGACLLVSVGETQSLTRTLEEVLCSETTREQLAWQGKKRAEQFTWQTLVGMFWKNMRIGG